MARFIAGITSCIPVLLFAILSVAPAIYATSLYNVTDPIWQLDINNFDRVIFGKNHVWLVEFYSAWCGHCIRFAPIYKRLAKDIENWKNVLEVAAVNCADSENTQLCRKYEITGYPTMQLFWLHVKEGDLGTKIEGSRDVTPIRRVIVKYLQSKETRTRPHGWPKLSQMNHTAIDIDSFWTFIPPDVNPVYVVIEDAGSYVGREVILDLSINKKITVRRVLTVNSELVHALHPGHKNASLVFMKLNKDGAKELVYVAENVPNLNSSQIRDDIFEIMIGKKRVKPDDTEKPDNPDDPFTVHDGVYMADLENALRYALYQEVGVHNVISGDSLKALRSYLLTLKQYFPGRPNVNSYLAKLSDWVSQHKGNITGKRFVSKLDDLMTDKEYLPQMQPWVGCRGSQPKYRGYPCSLWTLFHTLTVQAYHVYEKDPSIVKEAPQKVLFAIKGYVKNFFSCEECSKHFQEMSAHLEEEAKRPNDTVLWLWQAHNQVNKRLHGDETEDPKYVKIQFPSTDGCSKCRFQSGDENSTTIPWDLSGVLRYVCYYYDKDRIKRLNENGEMTSTKHQPGFSVAMDGKQSTSAGSKEDKSLTERQVEILLPLLNLFPLLSRSGAQLW